MLKKCWLTPKLASQNLIESLDSDRQVVFGPKSEHCSEVFHTSFYVMIHLIVLSNAVPLIYWKYY